MVGVSQSQSNVKEHDDIWDDDCWQVRLAHSNQLVLNGALRTEGNVHHGVRVVEHEFIKPVGGEKQEWALVVKWVKTLQPKKNQFRLKVFLQNHHNSIWREVSSQLPSILWTIYQKIYQSTYQPTNLPIYLFTHTINTKPKARLTLFPKPEPVSAWTCWRSCWWAGWWQACLPACS